MLRFSLILLFCCSVSAQPFVRNNLDTNSVGTAAADGWFLVSSNGIPLWSKNAGAATNTGGIGVIGAGINVGTTNGNVVTITGSNSVPIASSNITIVTNLVTGGVTYTFSSPNPTNNDTVVSNGIVTFVATNKVPATNVYSGGTLSTNVLGANTGTTGWMLGQSNSTPQWTQNGNLLTNLNAANLGGTLSSTVVTNTRGDGVAFSTTFYPTNSFYSTYQWASSIAALPSAVNLAVLSGGRNTNNVYLIFNRDTFWVTNTTWFVGTTESSQHWCIALYDLGGNLLWSDTVSTTSGNAITHTATNYKFVGGSWYYLNVIQDGSSGRVFGWTIGASELQIIASSGGPMLVSFQCGPSSLNAVPPSTLTLPGTTRFAQPPMGEIPLVIFQ